MASKRLCINTPCGAAPRSAHRCRPAYCHPGESKNWSACNMKNWHRRGSRKYRALARMCGPGYGKGPSSRRRPRLQVDAMELHRKMPYIWRFMTPRTKKRIMTLGKMSTRRINTWPRTPRGRAIARQLAAL